MKALYEAHNFFEKCYVASSIRLVMFLLPFSSFCRLEKVTGKLFSTNKVILFKILAEGLFLKYS